VGRMSHPVRTRVVSACVVALLLSACGGTTTNRGTAPSTSARPSAVPSTSLAPTTTRSAQVKVHPVRPPVATPATEPLDPQNWSSRQLAAELVMTGAKMGDTVAIEHAAARGVGGIVLFGPSSPDLARTLRRARAASPQGNSPLIASDEEGGRVQRLASLIYPLSSAEVMGRWSPARITETARKYALRMRGLGVSVVLGPSADIAVPGYFISAAHRSFSKNPQEVAVAVNAWNDGLRAAGAHGVVKHWPGHGQASDTHVGGSSVPPWSVLQSRDLIPFRATFAHHVDAVMVGHLRVPGLTEGSLPATESPTAMRALRAQAGRSALIVTDDLSMAAASTTLGITAAQAAVRSLVAGADVAMVCWAPLDAVISAVGDAINDGRLSRARAVASARRVLSLKAQVASSHPGDPDGQTRSPAR